MGVLAGGGGGSLNGSMTGGREIWTLEVRPSRDGTILISTGGAWEKHALSPAIEKIRMDARMRSGCGRLGIMGCCPRSLKEVL